MSAAFKLAEVLPWGRRAWEYEAFFALADLDPQARILDCAGGPSSFNAERSARGGRVISADPLYRFGRQAIAGRVRETRGVMLASLEAAKDRFRWTCFATPEVLEKTRLEACERFLADYDQGRAEGRYVTAALPDLPFQKESFDLALSSHFLFLYGNLFDAAFHVAAITEMARVAREVRIFPLLTLDGVTSPHLDPVRQALAAAGFQTTVERVDYEFQIGGHSQLRIRT